MFSKMMDVYKVQNIMTICNFLSVGATPSLSQVRLCHKVNYMENSIGFQKFLDFGNRDSELYTFTSCGVYAWKRELYIE